MKKKGSVFEERKGMDADLLSSFYRLLKKHPRLSIREILRLLVNSPASRFWVTEERARVVVASLLRGGNPRLARPERAEMFEEIARRALRILDASGGANLFAAVREAVRQPAPKFYITPGSANVLLCRARKRLRDERRRQREDEGDIG